MWTSGAHTCLFPIFSFAASHPSEFGLSRDRSIGSWFWEAHDLIDFLITGTSLFWCQMLCQCSTSILIQNCLRILCILLFNWADVFATYPIGKEFTLLI